MSPAGRVWKYGDNVDTDVIIPARYLNTSDPKTLAAHCLEGIDPKFSGGVRPGDIVLAGENFGCGSSREHAPVALKAAGVAAVVAASFARIFYRNAINIGLPILECPEAAAEAQADDTLEIDFREGTIRNAGRGREYQAAPFPAFLLDIIRRGGLMAHVRHEIVRQSGREERR